MYDVLVYDILACQDEPRKLIFPFHALDLMKMFGVHIMPKHKKLYIWFTLMTHTSLHALCPPYCLHELCIHVDKTVLDTPALDLIDYFLNINSMCYLNMYCPIFLTCCLFFFTFVLISITVFMKTNSPCCR